MTGLFSCSDASRAMLRVWLLTVAVLVILTLLVGGATRLTESGLSIVEWKPVTGVLPPLDVAAWQAEFDKYKTIPQYRERNLGMTLDQFKTIYWWEWSHRVLARLVGGAFLVPFLWFLWRGRLEPRLRVRLGVIFGAGAALGAVGWWMVSSGLSDRVSVSQYRLAFHLTLACAILAALLWTAADLRAPPSTAAAPARLRASAVALLVLILIQIYLGALVAGLRAGLLYNTWPMIDGSVIPDGSRLLFLTPAWRNFFENALTVQFDHRLAAYVVWLLALVHAIDVARTLRRGQPLTSALLLVSVITLQAALGILTLIYRTPLELALTHQAFGILALVVGVGHAHLLARQPERGLRSDRHRMPFAGTEQAT
ncbi:MAG: COX15/CtaA family protein [Xanthobacteraceae bacterium]